MSLIYRVALSEEQQIHFEMLARWCGKMYTGTGDLNSTHILIEFFSKDFLLLFFLVSMLLLWLKDGGSNIAFCRGQIALPFS